MASPEIVIVDYHKGNLLSVARSLSGIGGGVEISDDPGTIASAAGIICPGVGSFEDATTYMRTSGEADAIVRAIQSGIPFWASALACRSCSRGGMSTLAHAHGEMAGYLASVY